MKPVKCVGEIILCWCANNYDNFHIPSDSSILDEAAKDQKHSTGGRGGDEKKYLQINMKRRTRAALKDPQRGGKSSCYDNE